MGNALGIDIGTTGIKMILVSSEGTILGTWTQPHDLCSPQAGFAEEDPLVWKAHVMDLLREIAGTGNAVDAIGVTGMVPALVALDHEGNPVRPSIQQNDNRADKEMESLRSQFPDSMMLSRTGTRLNQQHIPPKVLWLKAHEPEAYQAIAHITGSYGYVAFLLTGNLVTERNWALESGMYDLHQERWIDEVLQAGSVSATWLPPVVKPTDVVGHVTDGVSRMTGLKKGIPVVAGTADHVASAFCVGARREGDLVFKLGGAGDILLAINHLVTDPRLFIDYGCTPQAPYFLNGCTATCGSLLKWFERELNLPDFTVMDERASHIPPTSEGVTILPYFLGEKTPIFDSHAKGTIFGLTLHHTKDHIYRALLEAVAYSINHHVEIMKERNLPIRRVFITNGGSKSKLWRQILADVTGYDVRYVRNNPGSCLGAALLAGMGAGLFDAGVPDRFLTEGEDNHHDPALRPVYDGGYQRYRALYEALKPLMQRTDQELGESV